MTKIRNKPENYIIYLIGLLTTCYPIVHVVICMALLFVKEPEGSDEKTEQTNESRVVY